MLYEKLLESIYKYFNQNLVFQILNMRRASKKCIKVSKFIRGGEIRYLVAILKVILTLWILGSFILLKILSTIPLYTIPFS